VPLSAPERGQPALPAARTGSLATALAGSVDTAVVPTPWTRDPAEQLLDGRRFARPGTVVFGALILTATLCAAAYVLVDPGTGLDSFTGRLGYAAFLAPVAWVNWRAACHPHVLVTADAVTVAGPVSRTVISWSAIEDVDEGVSIRLRNGKLIESFPFSDSLLADLCGDRAARRAIIAIRSGQREHRDEPRDPGYRREVDVGWRTALVATGLYAVASLVAALPR
jgi:hypothetical protein